MALLYASGTFLSPLHLGMSVASSDVSLLVLKAYLVDILNENQTQYWNYSNDSPNKESQKPKELGFCKGRETCITETPADGKGGESGGLIKVPEPPRRLLDLTSSLHSSRVLRKILTPEKKCAEFLSRQLAREAVQMGSRHRDIPLYC